MSVRDEIGGGGEGDGAGEQVSSGAPRRGLLLAAALIFGIGAVLFLLNHAHSYYPTDDGWLLAYAYRISRGEVPYRDFLWAQPPLSLYISSLLLQLPATMQFQAGRVLYYFELSLVAFLPLTWGIVTRRLAVNARTLGIAGILLLFSIHNMPTVPWTTVDAMTFASVTLTALLFSLTTARRNNQLALRVVAAVAAVLSAACRQSFVFVPWCLGVLAVGQALWGRRRPGSIRMLLAIALPGVLTAAAILGFFASRHALGPLAAMVNRGSEGGGLAQAGVVAYVRPFPVGLLGYACFFAMGLVAGRRRFDGRPLRGPLARISPAAWDLLLPLASLLLPLLLFLHPKIAIRSALGPFYVLAGALVSRLTTAVRGRTRWDGPGLLFHVAALVFAWTASISFGSQTPILGLGTSALAFIDLFRPRADHPHRLPTVVAVGALAAAFAVVQWLCMNRPYFDVAHSQQTGNLGDVYPKFGTLWTGAPNYQRFAELKRFIDEHAIRPDRPFVVMTQYPLIYFLTGRDNPTRVDWYNGWLIKGYEHELIAKIRSLRPVAILPREEYADFSTVPSSRPSCQDLEGRPIVVRESLKGGHLVAAGDHFCVFEPGGAGP